MCHDRTTWAGAALGLSLLFSCPAAWAQPRPHLFSMGRYTAAWAGQPRSYDQQLWDHMVNIGVTMTGSGLAWCDAEPTPGEYNWDAIDYADFAVDEIRARGMEPTFFVGLTPAWAALHPELEPHRTPPSEDYVEEFMDFHRFVADRYKGKVKYYFFWNEPNGCSWINDGCANADSYPLYTQWLIRCSQAIKEMDPDAKMIAGNLDYHAGVSHGYQYVQGMYDHGAGPYIDGIAIHPYDWAGTIHWQAITDTRDVMVAHGDADKGIWLTEYGWNGDYQTTAANIVSVLNELKKPEWSYVVQASYLVINDGPGVYDYGLMNEELTELRPGYYAYRDFDKTWPEYVDFSAQPTSGTVPLTVQFTDESEVVGADAWYWEFGDDQTSEVPNPSHTYTANGSYTVRLTVTGDGGPITKEKTDYIHVGVAEIVNPSYEDPAGFLNGWSSCLAGESSIKHNPSTQLPDPRFHDGDNSTGMSSDRPGDRLGAGAIFQEVAVVPGRTYYVRCWGALTEQNGQYLDDFMELRIRDGDSTPLNCSDNGANIVNNSQVHAHLDGQPATAWTPLEGNVTPTGDVLTVIAYWEFSGTAWGIKSLHLDDWSIMDITPPPPADFDGDLDVDEVDWVTFESCATGPAVGPPPEGCEAADFDQDDDVDQDDFSLFQRCFSGPNVWADPHCAD